MTTIFNPACDKYVVIMYHYIFDERPDRRGMHPRAPADFERELDFLAAHYQVVGTPLEVLAAARQGGPPTAALTFDDATRDQYENAAPRLEAHGLRGNFFVIGETLAGRLPFTHQLHLLFSQLSPRELVERYHRFLAEQFPAAGAEFRIPTDRHLNPLRLHDDVYTANFKERFPATPPAWQQKFLRQIFAEQGLREKSLTADLFMSAAQIKDLRRRGHTIGIHGKTHRPFDLLSLPEIEQELKRSVAILVDCLGEPPAVLSYPYGRLPAEPSVVLELVERSGLTSAVMMGYRGVTAEDDPLLIPRLNTNHLRDYLDSLS